MYISSEFDCLAAASAIIVHVNVFSKTEITVTVLQLTASANLYLTATLLTAITYVSDIRSIKISTILVIIFYDIRFSLAVF